MQYPEHEKMNVVKNDSQTIGEFLDWLRTQGVCFGKLHDNREFPFLNDHDFERKSNEQILATYFDIDLKKVEAEKQQMITDLRVKEKNDDR